MKRAAILILVMILGTTTVACQKDNSKEPAKRNRVTTEKNEKTEKLSEDTKVLIAYFTLGKNADYPENIDATTSASLVQENEKLYGTTEYVAKMIQDTTGGDLHLIETKDTYSSDFDSVVDQNHKEMDEGTLPEMKDSKLDISKYDTVFIGYPIWATKAPQVISSFISKYDLAEKTVIPFCTHDGYGAGNSYEDLKEALPKAEVLDGLDVEASDVPKAKNTVKRWLKEIGMDDLKSEDKEEQTSITVTAGDQTLRGVLYSTKLVDEIEKKLPITVSMSSYGGREYYGGIDFTLENIGKGQLNFENGEITYCEQNNTMAIFYAQTDQPDLSMEVIPIGKITSDLSVFDDLPETVDITFQIAK